jgi:hypothetical protein
MIPCMPVARREALAGDGNGASATQLDGDRPRSDGEHDGLEKMPKSHYPNAKIALIKC